MKEEEFEKEVSRRAGVPRDRARVLIRATLETLADRLTAGEAHDVASQLPKPMKEWLIRPFRRPSASAWMSSSAGSATGPGSRPRKRVAR